MTETPPSSTESTSATPDVITSPRYDYREHRPNRLYQIVAWVGIIAGVMFIVAVVFFSGLIAGRASGGYHGWQRGYQGAQTEQDGCPMRGPGGMMGPGQPYPTMMPPFTQRPS